MPTAGLDSTGPLLIPDPTVAGAVRLGDLHRAVVGAGLPLLWLNPMDRLVGTATVPVPVTDGERVRVPVRASDRLGDLTVTPLGECALTETGMVVPAQEEAVLAAGAVPPADEPAAPPAAEVSGSASPVAGSEDVGPPVPGAWSSLRPMPNDRRPRGREGPGRRAPTVYDRDHGRCVCRLGPYPSWPARQQAEWGPGHPLHRRVLDRYGEFPLFLTEPADDGFHILLSPTYWRAALWARFVDGCPSGHTFTLRQLLRELQRAGVPHLSGYGACDAVVAYLHVLHRHRLVAWDLRTGPYQDLTVTGEDPHAPAVLFD